MEPIQNDRKVIFGPVRLSYAHLFDKYAPNGDLSNAKYSASLLIPKHDEETVVAIRKAMDCAKALGIQTKWNGKEPKKVDLALRDGDDKDDEAYHGHWYINAKSDDRVGVVDRENNPIFDAEEVYSGCYVNASVTFYAYSVSGNNGIACGLNHVMKWRDGERFGGKASAQSDFAGITIDDDDDL